MAEGWVSFEGLVCFRGSLDSGRVSTPAVDCKRALLLPVGTGGPTTFVGEAPGTSVALREPNRITPPLAVSHAS